MAGMVGVMIAASSSASTLDFPILTALILVPLIGAVAVLFLGRMRAEWGKLAALTSSVVTGALSLWVLQAFDS
ncbi:MAG: Fe-S-binding domain-containing protein, partial [Ilumatobacteraceae bacterium]